MKMDTTHKHDANDTFLSQWLAGNLSDEQLKQIVSEADFEAYQKLKSALDSYQVAEPDMEKNFAKIRQKRIGKIHPQKQHSRVVPLFRYGTIAAALLLFFGLYQLLAFSNSATTGFGKTGSVHLKDGSAVALNAKSRLDFPALFKYNRTLKLEGEAYFEVKKGSAFTVKTADGDVQVLGTRFNVVSRPDYFEVVCFEGKVKVCKGEKSTILTKGDGIRYDGKQPENWKEKRGTKPLWLSGESGFRKAPFHHVVSQLQQQYHYEVHYPQGLRQVKFSGSFSNTDLNAALQSVCLPLNLKYKISHGKIIISE